MWNEMWVPDFSLDTDTAVGAGFTVYDVSYDPHGLLPFDTIIGINSAGYDFHELHWKPLRDALADM